MGLKIPRGAAMLLPIIFAALMALTGCKNWFDPPREIIPPQGQVLEYGTNKPIPGATVKIFGNCGGDFLGNFNCDLLETLQSDNDGYYQSTKDAFEVSAQKEGFFEDYDLSSTIITSGSEKKANVILTPYAWLKVTIHNESGAWGFGSSQLFGQNSGGKILQNLGDEYIVDKLVEGNKDYKLIFSVLVDKLHTTKDLTKMKVQNKFHQMIPIDTTGGGGALSVIISAIGHDTTDITIIY